MLFFFINLYLQKARNKTIWGMGLKNNIFVGKYLIPAK